MILVFLELWAFLGLQSDTQELVQLKWNATKKKEIILDNHLEESTISLFLSFTYQTIFLFNLPEDNCCINKI